MKMWSFSYVTNGTWIRIRFWQIAFPNTPIQYSMENVYPADPLVQSRVLLR